MTTSPAAGVARSILLIIYKRPELTRRALEAIVQARPSRLFVAADGPRSAAEAAACRATRAVLGELTYPCEVLTNFSDVNLGCGIRVHTAIDWALSISEDLIILEDDCLPNPSFFQFCDTLLARYRDDERVMHISGNNFVGDGAPAAYSYYFSKYTHAWGWATWRRAWRHFDWAMSAWPAAKEAGVVESRCADPYERRYWTAIFDQMHAGAPDTWDYQWNFACWAQGGLTVLPSVNLVSNTGVGEDATHTKAPADVLGRPTHELRDLRHPPYVFQNTKADEITFDRNFGGAAMRAVDRNEAALRRRFGPALGPLRALKRLVRDRRPARSDG
jgi:hypothetical protein